MLLHIMDFAQEIDAFFKSRGLERGEDVVTVALDARTPGEAIAQHQRLEAMAGSVMFILEDRWNSQREMMEARLLAHHRTFAQVYARNCEVRRIDKPMAASFLAQHHSYGDASCKYRYGLFAKRLTGEKGERIPDGTMVAVAEFSSARNWKKGEKNIRSCEWVRYASLPGIRVEGGMGKMLKHFIEEVKPDDVMSYADLEWSDGSVYRQLGFAMESVKSAVMFRVDDRDWTRTPVKEWEDMAPEEHIRWYLNFGSVKYRLKLIDY